MSAVPVVVTSKQFSASPFASLPTNLLLSGNWSDFYKVPIQSYKPPTELPCNSSWWQTGINSPFWFKVIERMVPTRLLSSPLCQSSCMQCTFNHTKSFPLMDFQCTQNFFPFCVFMLVHSTCVAEVVRASQAAGQVTGLASAWWPTSASKPSGKCLWSDFFTRDYSSIWLSWHLWVPL